MTIILVCWVCVSAAVCLAILGAAARPLPKLAEGTVSQTQTDLESEAGMIVERTQGRPFVVEGEMGMPVYGTTASR